VLCGVALPSERSRRTAVAEQMEPSVRQALLNLQGMHEEGFVTKKEFEARRKAILDKATGVEQSGSTKSSSVFDRLGTGTAGGKWGHDGFNEIYGGSKKGRQTGQARLVTVVGGSMKDGKKLKAGDLRLKLSEGGNARSKVGSGDLRAKITGGGVKKRDLRQKLVKSRLPDKCPW
jgi:hypothetical protein